MRQHAALHVSCRAARIHISTTFLLEPSDSSDGYSASPMSNDSFPKGCSASDFVGASAHTPCPNDANAPLLLPLAPGTIDDVSQRGSPAEPHFPDTVSWPWMERGRFRHGKRSALLLGQGLDGDCKFG